jgi:hypothetical protein
LVDVVGVVDVAFVGLREGLRVGKRGAPKELHPFE